MNLIKHLLNHCCSLMFIVALPQCKQPRILRIETPDGRV
uniref:Uncharacterized protein n=1 Tax=Arundo donax TaxID=35708 RepID=A0A0A9H6E1_ARUDO